MGRERLTRESALAWPRLVAAYIRARAGKRRSPEAAAWFRNWESRLLTLRARLDAGYVFGPYRVFVVRDPKVRQVAAAPFDDRVVHHVLVDLLSRWFEPAMIPTSVACRTGKGGAAARDALARACRTPGLVYVAHTDVRRYFASIRHDRLLRRLDKACGDDWARALMRSLLASWETDGTPGTGIPIGNLTSQLFANVYLDEIDHFMVRTARVRGYLRYVDDIVWFAEDKPTLWAQLGMLRERLVPLGLTLHPKKTRVGRVVDGADFAGLVVSPTWIRLRGATKRRALRHLASVRRRWRRGELATERYFARMQSFIALGRGAGARGLLARRGLAW